MLKEKSLSGTTGSYSFDNNIFTIGVESGIGITDAKPISAAEKIGTEIEKWMLTYSELSPLHGMKWFSKNPNFATKIFMISFVTILVICCPTLAGNKIKSFFDNSTGVKCSNSEIKETKNLNYPNLTVCFTQYFDKRLLKVENISDDLSNYMTLALDPDALNHIRYMKKSNLKFETLLDSLHLELETILQRSELNILQLFQKVAIRCHDFINFCELSRSSKYSWQNPMDGKTCCKVLFDSKAIFTSSGTCFVTKIRLTERIPLIHYSMNIWLNALKHLSSGYSPLLRGFDVTERSSSVFYTLSQNDHPATSLYKNAFKIREGKSGLVSLKINQVLFSDSSNQICRSEFSTSKTPISIPYTYYNCQFYMYLQSHNNVNCSILPFFGLVSNPAIKRLCLPNDLINGVQSDEEHFLMENIDCLPACDTVEYTATVTEGTFDIGSTDRFYNLYQQNSFVNPNDTMSLRIYFGSNYYEIKTFEKEPIHEKLATLGGIFGMLVGFSMIAFIELIYMISLLTYRLIKKLFQE